MTKHLPTVLATCFLALACSGTTSPSGSTYVGEWVGSKPYAGSSYIHVDLRIDTATATSVTGMIVDGENFSAANLPCGSATGGASFSQGQLYPDSLVFFLVCAVGTYCAPTVIRYRAKPAGNGLSLNDYVGQEIPLTKC